MFAGGTVSDYDPPQIFSENFWSVLSGFFASVNETENNYEPIQIHPLLLDDLHSAATATHRLGRSAAVDFDERVVVLGVLGHHHWRLSELQSQPDRAARDIVE